MLIIHLGSSGFPKETTAIIQRIKLTHKGLKLAGCNPLIISKHSLNHAEKKNRLNRYHGIPYVLTSLLLTRPENFIVRKLNRLSGYIGELNLLVKKRKNIQAAIFSGPSFFELVYYRLLSKILSFKLIVQYVELSTAITYKRNWRDFINAWILDNYRFFFCDGIIVISEYLKNRVYLKNKKLPLIKIPAICDFEEFKPSETITTGNYLMYCGAIGYYSVIEFVINLYSKLRESGCYEGKLLLAIGLGDRDKDMADKLTTKINECEFKESIILNINVPHQELINIYLGAELLIVPMRDALQDIAGFHHKVGEYCAAKKPIISTNLGEMKFYFKDGISAILADEYTIESYLKKLSEILPLKENLKAIAEGGHKVGLEKLNYLNYGKELKQFIFDV
jgi:glycosyltransferase involved in cell wall biosynthesis